MDSAASQMVHRSKETSHPVFINAIALSLGILRMLKGKQTLHFNEDASNTELLFRITHSVDQLSNIYGAVTNWCEQFGLTEKVQERPPGRKESVTKGTLKSVSSQE